MKSSIRTRLFITFIAILLIAEIGLVILSNLFLNQLGIYANKVLIKNVYEEYNPYFKLDEINIEHLNSITSENDIGIIIYDNNVIKACSSLSICKGDNPTIPSYITNRFGDIKENEGNSYHFDHETIDVNQLAYIYNSGNGRYIIMEKSLTPIQEINQIIRPVIFITGILVFFLGSVSIYFTSKRISDPIIKISGFANELANLNFEDKLLIDQKDEIGQLAVSMNLISRRLNTALNELKKDLEKEKELDRKRVKFFSTVSHEFKTPLTIIQGYAEGIKNNITKTKEDQNDYCDIIIDESKKMGLFVNDLLNLSLYESDNFNLNKTEFDLVDLVKEVSSKFNDLVVSKQVQFNVMGLSTCKVCADKYRIEQVINNLTSNAIKYVNEFGLIQVNIMDKNDTVALYFFNNGDQIDEKDMHNIWSLFYKLQENKNRIGTGIGLSIVKSIIDLHDGKYGVENTDDGVEFYIEIPK